MGAKRLLLSVPCGLLRGSRAGQLHASERDELARKLTLNRLDLLASGYAPQLGGTGPGGGEEHRGVGREAEGGESSSIADLGTEVGEGLEVAEDGSADVDEATEGDGGFRTLASYALTCPVE